MKSKQAQFIIGIIGVVILVAGIGFVTNKAQGPSKYDGFAQCLATNGAEFYGTFWCPHCQNQKKMFGRAKQYLPYIECSTLDGKSQLPICTEKKIEGYPTWIFKDGSRLTGEIPLPTLAEKTQCALPE
ncbi:MAG: thioredoxin domain-containing protein [Candidatus Paceibacterota bacterium]